MRQTLRNNYPLINNRYHVIELLGSGGMASVYLAHDEVLDRNVALKVLNHHFANDEEFVERFRREARISAALSHPNIASVYDFGEIENGSYYMAMEYAPGGTLRDLIRKEGTLAPSKAVEIAIQVAQALEAAHAYGAIHRDVKPQNILLTRMQEVKVVDFGIARAATLSEITKEGHVLGTENYMSPEQAKGAPVGPGSDLYSLGVVLYEMLTGNLPHEAFGPLLGDATLAKRLSGYPRPPKEINSLIPDKLSAIVVKLLSEDPRLRYSNAYSLIADLEQAKGESLGSTATRILNSAFLKGRALRDVTTRALNSAARQARTNYQTLYRRQTRNTRLYKPPASIPSPKAHKLSWGKPVRGQRQKQKPLSRSLLVVLAVVAVLVSLNLMDPSAKARLSAEVQRTLENTLRGVEHSAEKALENELYALENKIVDSISGFFTSSLKDQSDVNSPYNLPSAPLPQSPSNPYNPPSSGTSHPSNSPGGSPSPDMYAPYPNTPPQDSYQQPHQEIQRQIDKNLQSIEKVFGPIKP